MRRHVIAGRMGIADRVGVPAAQDEILTEIPFVAANRRLDFGIGRAIEDLVSTDVFPSEVGVDLLVLAAHVHAADTRISRDTESQDTWTRELRLVVPVSDPARWNAARPILRRMLNFLTGDLWEIGFRRRPQGFEIAVPEKPRGIKGVRFDALSLFSGGLDSLIGAIDTLERGERPLFISHAGEGATSESQNALFDGLRKHYDTRAFDRLRLWMQFPNGLIPDVASENSTRGRSFLFFSAGMFAGTGFPGEFVLNVPENGLIALNVPLDQLRLGSHSTRTTHPFYMARWNELARALGINGRVRNPYWDRTKGEMVAACGNRELLQRLLPVSLSCSSPTKGRWAGASTGHCGYCLPCLIRRASVRAGLPKTADPTTYTVDLRAKPLDTMQSVGQQVRSFQYMIHRVQRNPQLAALLINKPGPLSDESPDARVALADVYRRGLEELSDLLKGVVTTAK